MALQPSAGKARLMSTNKVCPFVVGQRLNDKYLNKIVIVTEVSPEGFSWEFEGGPRWMGTRIGWYKSGVCYPEGFIGYEDCYEK